MRVPEPPGEDGSTPDSNLCRLNQVEAQDASALAAAGNGFCLRGLQGFVFFPFKRSTYLCTSCSSGRSHPPAS